MTEPTSKLFLLDSMALLYRGHFALVRNPRLTSQGVNTSGVFVFTNTLISILTNENPTHIAAAFDTPEPTHRHQAFTEYKARREAMPEDLREAIPHIYELCEAFNIPVLRAPGWEADDIVGTVTRWAQDAEIETYMVTSDKDYGQLVSERTFMYKPGRTGVDAEVLGIEEILARWQIEEIGQLVDVLGLMGDTSDNVPGVPGIGEKTAQKLIARFGSIDNLLAHTDELKGKQKENVEANREQALLSRELVTIDREVPLDVELEDLRRQEWDKERLARLFVELEFDTLGKRLLGDSFEAGPQRSLFSGHETTPEASPPEQTPATLQTIGEVAHDYRLADTPEARRALVSELQQQTTFCFDTETTGLDPKTCGLVGVAFSFAPHAGYYVPIPQGRDAARAILAEFGPVLQDGAIEKIGHNLKYDLSVLRWHDVRVGGPFFDTMIAAYLAAPDLRRTMDYLAQSFLAYRPVSITELIGEKGSEQRTMRDVPLEQVVEYAVEDADVTLQLAAVLRPKLEETDQQRIFAEVECPLLPVLVEMEYQGIRMEAGALHDLAHQLQANSEMAAERVFELAGEHFNLNSPQQLGQILFEKMALDPSARRTRQSRQYQTSEQVLRRLARSHEIAQRVLDYRLNTKLKSTYVDMLPGTVHEATGRIHTQYEQAVTATGRMQSHSPNLQTIPVRSEQGREIRKAFVARDQDYQLLSADYSQIELRVAAELSGDAAMIETFQKGGDIHTATAARIYGVDEESVTADMRRQAKTVNFGIIYGISPFGLGERLDIPRTEAAQIIEQYFAQFPGIRRYVDETIAFAREHGFVATMMGRRRYLRDINSANDTTRKGAERNAINTRIQGTAADMIKIAMSRIQTRLDERQLQTKMLLQVHDELLFDLHRDDADTAPPLIEEEMRTAIPMSVPIEVEIGMGRTWLEAH